MPNLNPNLKLLSHSSINLLHTCPRKWELYRSQVAGDFAASVDTAFGSAFGSGIQSLIVTKGDLDKAIMEAFKNWDVPLSEEKPKTNKSFWEVVSAIETFAKIHLNPLLKDWEVAVLANGKPASELSFKINLPKEYKYRGFVDLVLKHRREPLYKIWELKTTGSYSVHQATYQNSFQGVGYGIVLDKIAEGIGAISSFDVDYYVYKTASREFERMVFLKNRLQRMRWISQLLNEVEKIEGYAQLDQFPMHGESCVTYNRPCGYFGICEMSNSALIPTPKEGDITKEDIIADFEFNIEDLLANQISLIKP